MRKRGPTLFFALLSAALVLCGLWLLRGRLPALPGPLTQPASESRTTAPPVLRPVELARAGMTRYHYQQLGEAEQRAYRDIFERLPGFPESVEVTGLDTNGLNRVFQALLLDQPLLLQISSVHYTTRTLGDKPVAFIPEYRMGPVEYRERCVALARACASIAAGGDEFERELALHDALVAMCDYTEEERSDKATAYGALVERSASCEGYSKAMLLLLELQGMEACIITGNASNEGGQSGGHAWNQVRVGGAWYHLDATWDDPVVEGAPSGISHAYFNIPDADIAHTHELTGARNPCISVEANFYVRRGLYFQRFEKAEETVLAQRLAESLAAGGNTAELRMANDGALEDALYELFDKNGPQRVYRVLSNAALVGPYPIRTDKVMHSEIGALRVIRIFTQSD